MTYWIILFQVDPVPLGAPGPIKLKVSRRDYDVAGLEQRAKVTVKGKGDFIIQSKMVFCIEEENMSFLVAKVEKVKYQTGRDFLK